MVTWSQEELRRIGASDDLHVAPYREDGTTPGTLTWIWSVVVDDDLYVRAYNGGDSRWYRAAIAQHAGLVRAAGLEREVTFSALDGSLNERIDAAYRAKYAGSPYLDPMVSPRARAATVRIIPRVTGDATAIELTVGASVLQGTLLGTPAAQDFAALLPLTLTLRDFGGTEKISDLPAHLSTAGSPDGTAADAGDIAYYAPWGNLAIFYRASGHAQGLVRLGRLKSGIEHLAGLDSGTPVTIQAATAQ